MFNDDDNETQGTNEEDLKKSAIIYKVNQEAVRDPIMTLAAS